MTAHHPSEQLLRHYERGDDLAADQLWAVESHLENCAPCRGRLAPDPLATAVWAELAPIIDRARQLPRTHAWWRWVHGWVSPVAGPWLAMILLVTAAAVALDRLGSVAGGRVSLVLLIAPVLPVLGVAASWGPALDPVHELTVGTPRAGLGLVFRRTASVLAVVVPALTAASSLTGLGLSRWLLPCLAFTAGTLALGALVGVTRAAIAFVAAWVLAIIVPTVAFGRTSVVLAVTPLWAGVLLLGIAVITLRRKAFTRLGT
ncbi:zf-HC2 domain-containing protein [Lentzea sp. NPDC004782]|uniref:zf-HC2 domain-containing protein n=1 Tax=Lentzea sp. NPDC004782 TaxID=3154458 RepID=UPI0033ACD95D